MPLCHITDSVYFREYFADVRKDLLCNYTINTKLPSFTFKLGANSAQNRTERLEINEYGRSKTLQTLRVKMTNSPPADLPLFTAGILILIATKMLRLFVNGIPRVIYISPTGLMM